MKKSREHRRSNRSRNTRRRRPTVGLTLLLTMLLLGSACAGPRTPVAVGVKEFPSDVLLGIQSSDFEDPGALVTEPNPVVRVVRRVQQPVQPPPPPPPPPVIHDCPSADPLSAPREVASNRASQPPVEESYAFRTSGHTSSGDDVELFPEEVTRTVQNVEPPDDDGVYSFEVVEQMDSRTTTTSYSVIPNHDVADLQGIYLTRTEVTEGDDTSAFNWNPPVKMMPFPAESGAEWSVASTASNGQTVLSFDAMIGESTEEDTGPIPDDPLGEEDGDDEPTVENHKVRVDACGVFIDAWNIQIFNGRLVSPTNDISFEESHAFATQFGGLSVKETRLAEGVVDGAEVETQRESIINTEPGLPGA